ncbi:hypothetical protein [Rubritalea tangerina]
MGLAAMVVGFLLLCHHRSLVTIFDSPLLLHPPCQPSLQAPLKINQSIIL